MFAQTIVKRFAPILLPDCSVTHMRGRALGRYKKPSLISYQLVVDPSFRSLYSALQLLLISQRSLFEFASLTLV